MEHPDETSILGGVQAGKAHLGVSPSHSQAHAKVRAASSSAPSATHCQPPLIITVEKLLQLLFALGGKGRSICIIRKPVQCNICDDCSSGRPRAQLGCRCRMSLGRSGRRGSSVGGRRRGGDGAVLLEDVCQCVLELGGREEQCRVGQRWSVSGLAMVVVARPVCCAYSPWAASPRHRRGGLPSQRLPCRSVKS